MSLPRWQTQLHRKLTTFKTVFLLALATGARRSELHALSRRPRDLIISASQASLRTKPSFLAKNQVAGSDSTPFFVKALTPFTGRDSKDRLLCPVRILKYYLEFTKGSDKNGPLFVKLSGEGNPKAATISSWLKNTIQFVYAHSEENVHAHAHEVRKTAASWAYFGGVSPSKIIEAGKWRTQTTFTSYYLADVTKQRDGFYRPLPCVAMGAVCKS